MTVFVVACSSCCTQKPAPSVPEPDGTTNSVPIVQDEMSHPEWLNYKPKFIKTNRGNPQFKGPYRNRSGSPSDDGRGIY